MSSEPIRLAPDLFEHTAVAVRLTSPDLGRKGPSLQGRCIRKTGMLLEIRPPLRPVHPFSTGASITASLCLPHQDEVLSLSGVVSRVLLLAVDPNGGELSLVGIRFERLDPAVLTRLEGHEIATQSTSKPARSARIPVRFPVEPAGIDLISQLMAVDLSMTGMYVAGKARFPVGKALRLGFRLPFQKEKVSLSCEVVWLGEKQVSGIDSKVSGFGLRFTEVPPQTRAALATYYARSMPLGTP